MPYIFCSFAVIKSLITLATSSIFTLSFLAPVAAQIIPDRTTNTTVELDGTINNGDRVGDNLFHSFQEFSISNNGQAFFNNDLDIANIFSRITGGNISQIDGLIKANGTANLFLINPAGIIFGENARLSLGGSFFGSTADSILFPDTEFSTKNLDNPPLLTINVPIGLNFSDNPGQIIVSSDLEATSENRISLEVSQGEHLALIGGNIAIENSEIRASEGRITLGGLSEAEIITFNQDGDFIFPESLAKADINLKNNSNVDVSGTGGGSIDIHARNLNLEAGDLGNSKIRAGITTDSTSADAQAGDITIEITENLTLDNESKISNIVDEEAFGNAGNINIITANLTLTKGSQIEATTFGIGNGGSIEINASNIIAIDGEDSDRFPSGISSRVQSNAVGDAGNVNVTTGSLHLTNGGRVGASVFSLGNGGSVTVIADNAITMDSENSTGRIASGIASRVGRGGEGNSGDVNITTSSLSLTNGGSIGASNSSKEQAGNVTINARESILIAGEGRIRPSLISVASVANGGNGGIITIVTNQITLNERGRIEADNFPSDETGNPGTGKPGQIEIVANSLILNNQANINTKTQFGTGNDPNIRLTITDDITLRNNSFISSQAQGNANGGNIIIETGFIIAFPNENSDIIAIAEQGKGGTIQINAEALLGIEEGSLNDLTNDINASSELGIDGTIIFNTPDVDPTSGVFQLPDIPLDAEGILAQNLCKVEDEEIAKGSSFLITGKGGVTPTSEDSLENLDRLVSWSDRDDIQVSQDGLVSIRTRSSSETAQHNYPVIQQSQGWVQTLNGDIWLVANPPETISKNIGIAHPDCQASSNQET